MGEFRCISRHLFRASAIYVPTLLQGNLYEHVYDLGTQTFLGPCVLVLIKDPFGTHIILILLLFFLK